MQVISGGIIAAGHGSRLRKKGFDLPKPLIKVGGRELLGRTVEQFKNAGIQDIRVIFRTSICQDCSSYLRENFPETHFEIICKDTKSSAASFLTLLEKVPDNRPLLITTVDSVLEEGALKRFAKEACQGQGDLVVLGITRYVDDEKPLYVTLDRDNKGVITAIGGKSGDAVTCGVYLVPPLARKAAQGISFPALRAFLAHIFEQGIPFRAVDMGTVIDVDRPEDIEKAEAFVSGSGI